MGKNFSQSLDFEVSLVLQFKKIIINNHPFGVSEMPRPILSPTRFRYTFGGCPSLSITKDREKNPIFYVSLLMEKKMEAPWF